MAVGYKVENFEDGNLDDLGGLTLEWQSHMVSGARDNADLSMPDRIFPVQLPQARMVPSSMNSE